jgi:hypothetical protein
MEEFPPASCVENVMSATVGGEVAGAARSKGGRKIMGTSIGISVVIILLVPIFFQTVTQGLQTNQRHREIMEALRRIEDHLSG